jgi:hypothetical protein
MVKDGWWLQLDVTPNDEGGGDRYVLFRKLHYRPLLDIFGDDRDDWLAAAKAMKTAGY